MKPHEIPGPWAQGWAHLGMLFGLVAALATASRRVGDCRVHLEPTYHIGGCYAKIC